jgi:SAM-dependent methyltransferase
MKTFDNIAVHYERAAVVQRSAGLRLLDSLAIGPAEDVLDLGCGPGHLTRQIRGLTAGAGAGLDVCRIDRVVERHTSDALWRVFESGAGTAYLSPEHYRGPWTPGYREAACERIRAAFASQAGQDGLIEVVFNRLYLLAHKP